MYNVQCTIAMYNVQWCCVLEIAYNVLDPLSRERVLIEQQSFCNSTAGLIQVDSRNTKLVALFFSHPVLHDQVFFSFFSDNPL